MNTQFKKRLDEYRPDEKSAGPVLTIAAAKIPILFALLCLCLLIVSASIDVLKYRTVLLDQIGSFDRLLRLFDVDMEASFATFLSALMLLTCAALAFLTSRIDAAERARGWTGMCLLFLILAFDEAVMLHEASVKLPLALGLLAVLLTGPHKYPSFLLEIPRATLAIFLAAGVIYLTGAIILDELHGPYLKEFGSDNLGYKMGATAEEALEMGGILLFTTGLVFQLKRLGAAELHLGTSVRPSTTRSGAMSHEPIRALGEKQNVLYPPKLHQNGGRRSATRNI
jgi:hypothetical protein